MKKRHEVLIVDDEPANLQKLKRTFWEDFEVLEAADGGEALRVLERRKVVAIITDQRMPGMSGVELLERSLALSPDAVRIILTGYTDVEDLMDAINQGHVHRYITKPWDPYSLLETVRREIERWELKRENERLARELQSANQQLSRENARLRRQVEAMGEAGHRLLYTSRAMDELLKLLARVVKTDSTVLIQGETGTGKELLARHIHEQSDRAGAAFVPVNCGAIPRELMESAFFGHRKGSFTGATEDRKGFFEAADGGTLFLDEVGEAPLELQVKLLRVLQEGEILRVGAQSAEQVDVRVIASTNRNLGRMVEEGAFRQDLFFRLNVFSVLVPPLRTRPEDVRLLAEHFLAVTCRRLNKRVAGFDAETLSRLERYEWPGNVRELENEVERLVILCDPGETVGIHLLSDRIRHDSVRPPADGDLRERISALERSLILGALKEHNNNKSRAAEALGITRQTIISKLKRYQNRKPVLR